MKKLLTAFLVAAMSAVSLADMSVKNVEAHQRYPWNGLVDIVVSLECSADDIDMVDCSFVATNGATGAAIPVTCIAQQGSDTGSGTTWTRRYVWDAAADVGAVKIDDVAFTVDAKVKKVLGGVQLWENGPYWAECNVGATKPEEYGYYFWWGDTVGYKRNTANDGWISVKDASSFTFDSGNCPTRGKNNSQLQSADYIDATGNLVAAHDAAMAHLGAPWRMPTDAEFDALISNCDTTWTTRDGVYGRLVTGRGAYASKSIFLPAAGNGYGSGLYSTGSYGCYWSSTCGAYNAWNLNIDSDHVYRGYGYYRNHGQSVRPLRGFADGVMPGLQAGAGVTTRLTLDCQTGKRTAAATEVLTYSTEWSGAGNGEAVAVVAVDGVTISERSGSGTVEWTPTDNGTYVLTHKVMVGGEQVGEALTTTFSVDHFPARITDVTAHQRYPWNGKVDIAVTIAGVAADDMANIECAFAATNSATGAAIPITSITQQGSDTGSGTTWTRRYVWDAAQDVGVVKVDDVALTVGAMLGVQLWENGPCWARCNVGATKPEEYGYYFWWGGTVAYTNIPYSSWISVKGGSSFKFTEGNCPTYGKNISNLRSAGYIDTTGNLVAAHDAATAHLGAPWRMPTGAEIVALISNCDTTWTTRGGVYGSLVTGKGAFASKSIFLPAAGYGDKYFNAGGRSGYYRSSTPDSDYSSYVWGLNFDSNYYWFHQESVYRNYGQPVRPLRGFADSVISGLQAGVGVTTHLTLDCQTGTRTAAATETIVYSTEWAEGAGDGATAVIAVDGVTLSNQSGGGTVAWTPEYGGTYELTHKVMAGGSQVGETLTATFSVSHFPDMAFTASDYAGTYDGTGHGIIVNVTDPAEESVVTYSRTEDGEYTTAPILFTDVTHGAQSVYFKIAATGYATASGVATVTIWPRPPSITGVTARQRYPWNGLVDIVVTMEGVTADDVAAAGCAFAATNSATGAAIPITSITQQGADTGSGTAWTRRFVWDAAQDVGAVKIDDVALTVGAILGVQLWEDGPYWAERNVGATKPEEYGYYFWWGDTVGYKRNAADDGWISVKDGSSFSFTEGNCPTWGKDNSQLQSAGYIDSTGNLVAAHDAATAHLGAPWRMPTDAEFAALLSNCDTTWTTRGGVYGRLVTGRGAYASKSIFLPAAYHGYGSDLYDADGSNGFYWSSTPFSYGHGAWSLYFYSFYIYQNEYGGNRDIGRSVRPLRGFANGVISDSQAGVGVTTRLTLDCQTGTRTAAATELLTYSTEWAEGAGDSATAIIAVNGVTLSERSGNGTVEWMPSDDGTYELTHKVMAGGEQVGETLTAMFSVGHFPGIAFTASDYAGTYDGTGHGITVTVTDPASGAVVTYSRTADGEYTTTPITFTDATKRAKVVYFRIAAENYTPTNGVAKVMVAPRPVTLTSGSAKKPYDGTALSNPDIAISGSGWVEGEGATYDVTGSQTAVGSSVNAFVYALNANTKAANYTITTVEGTLTVTSNPMITGVTARQRYPWNGKVDISYAVENIGTEELALSVWAVDQTTGVTNFAKSVTGDTAYTGGRHKIVWDMAADGLTLVSTNVVFGVSYEIPPLYCVIDLSGGTSASSYPVTYLDEVPPGGWSDEYKTTKLVLRKIPAGTFTMGSPTDELGRLTYYDETQHQVTLTKDFFVGVFQVTQRQWELVMGTRPSYFDNNACYASRPVECVSYDMIRGSSAGAGWPNSSDVDATSFLGLLRAKSGLMLDLPTEAQWEYACRAGTTTALNSGKNLTSTSQDAEMDKVGRYWYNGGSGYSRSCDWSAATAKVGSYAPNAWGLYDMHGNVWEWCLDWYGSYSGDETNPKGSSSGSDRVVRGGGWYYYANYCRSAYRGSNYPPNGYSSNGFRLVRTLPEDVVSTVARSEAVAATSGASDPVRVDLTAGTRTAKATEAITYSSDWVAQAGADATAVVAVDGETISEQSGSGTVEWMPTDNGTYVLTHKVISDGEQVGETLTATFLVNPPLSGPTVPGDPGAVVTGDAESGYTVQPSVGKTAVEVTIPPGVDAKKVTVELGTEVETVKPNGAKVKVVKGANDITDYLDIPAADASGAVDLTKVTVKEEIVKEAMDPEAGAEITLSVESPSITTSETKPGLTYTFSEGTTLEGMAQKSSKLGDGSKWSPTITVKGGTSGFYSIGVKK